MRKLLFLLLPFLLFACDKNEQKQIYSCPNQPLIDRRIEENTYRIIAVVENSNLGKDDWYKSEKGYVKNLGDSAFLLSRKRYFSSGGWTSGSGDVYLYYRKDTYTEFEFMSVPEKYQKEFNNFYDKVDFYFYCRQQEDYAEKLENLNKVLNEQIRKNK